MYVRVHDAEYFLYLPSYFILIASSYVDPVLHCTCGGFGLWCAYICKIVGIKIENKILNICIYLSHAFRHSFMCAAVKKTKNFKNIFRIFYFTCLVIYLDIDPPIFGISLVKY